jgi:hypothetical protein
MVRRSIRSPMRLNAGGKLLFSSPGAKLSGGMAETFEQRLKRYVDQPAVDTLGWMTMMLHNYHVDELRRAREAKLYQCVYLLAHSIVQTVSETMFGLPGLSGTRFFLERFADGAAEDRKFSKIAAEIHDVRNIIAHHGYSKMQHEVQYFIDDIPEGWRREMDGSLIINPALYSAQVEDVFRHPTLDSTFCQQPPLNLLRTKYRFVRQWLGLEKDDAITTAIKALDKLDATADEDIVDAKIAALCTRALSLTIQAL